MSLMIEYRITHITTYDYTESVSVCQNVAHLLPREVARQEHGPSVMEIDPEPAVLEERLDYFGNPTTYFTVQEPHKTLKVTVSHQVLVKSEPSGITTSPPWEQVRDRLTADRSQPWLDAYEHVFDSRYCPSSKAFAEYALTSFQPGRMIHEAGLELTKRIFSEFVYDPVATTVATPVKEVFQNRRGVCQDFAHLQIACLRSIGLPARYVSGYLSTVPPPGRPRLIGADATHAWVSLFLGEAGWLDLDPTNNQVPGDRHILLAWGRDYDDVSPIKGIVLGGGQHSVTVNVDVHPETKS
ncbi:MAG: transglutaminase family protein [Fimbriiglobus sp.]